MKLIQNPTKKRHQDAAMSLQNKDVEEIILGTLLNDAQAIYRASALLRPNMFSIHTNGMLYAEMFELYEKSIPIDMITLAQACLEKGFFKQIGGMERFTTLSNRVASSANVEYHIRILQQYWIKRTIGATSHSILTDSLDITKDSLELLDSWETELMHVKDSVFAGSNQTIDIVVRDFEKYLESETPPFIKLTGIPELDNKMDGATEGDFVVVAGRPGMGKSSLVNTILINAVQNDIPMLFWSLEMSNRDTITRMVSGMTGINSKRIKKKEVDSEDEIAAIFAATDQIGKSSIVLEDTAGINASDFRSKIISLKRQKEIKIAIVDRIGLLKFFNEDGNRTNEITRITNLFRRTAREFGITIIGLNQLSRAVETRGGSKRPYLSDLRDSGSLEQDATKVLLLYRPEYYDILEDEEGRSLKNRTSIDIAKNTNVETAPVWCDFDPNITRFLAEQKTDYWDDFDSIDYQSKF